MITFKGEPNMLVRVVPPIGTIKHIRFSPLGDFTTNSERLIHRLHHRFDSVPANGAEPTEEMTDDLELQINEQLSTKQYSCNKCDFISDNKGVLLAHKKADHPKEE